EVAIECVEGRECNEAVKAVVSEYRSAEDQHEQLRRPFVRTAAVQLLALLERSPPE
uniref:Uncharacterized protein n=1 Tax=Plectus sambesii TaxID=2011161 RepID=A0A914WQ49_9BILA